MKYTFIDTHRSEFPIVKMCQTLKVSKSGFHARSHRPLSKQKTENNLLEKHIVRLYEEHKGKVGSPSITADLRSGEYSQFKNVSRQRVARHMKKLGLVCKTTKKFVATTDSKHNEPIAENLLNRQFTQSSPNSTWVSDITYLKAGGKWYYLSVFIDLYSRIIVGWDLSDSLDRTSLLTAFSRAIYKRNPPKGLIVHSDRGVQYASKDFRNILKKHDFIQSMSRKGNCWDNAVAESFFHTLKVQCIHGERFISMEELQATLFEYIEIYYNRRRKHSANNWLSPADFENRNYLQYAA